VKWLELHSATSLTWTRLPVADKTCKADKRNNPPALLLSLSRKRTRGRIIPPDLIVLAAARAVQYTVR